MAAARVRIDKPNQHSRHGAGWVDLVVVDGMARTLELHGAEEELGRCVAGARRVETGQTSGKVDERDPHCDVRGYRPVAFGQPCTCSALAFMFAFRAVRDRSERRWSAPASLRRTRCM